MNEVIIRSATRDDYPRITSLLQAASLPTEKIAEHLQEFLVADLQKEVVGVIGLEVYGETALLRSAVVSASERNKGVGGMLYQRIVDRAREIGVRRLILLTNTAEEYFRRKGFVKIDQKSVTGPITASVEFTGACPSHAACMELFL